MPWGAAIAAVGAVAGAAVSADSAKSASNKQNDATNAALNAQRVANTKAEADSENYKAAGNASIDQLMIQLGLKPTSEVLDPAIEAKAKYSASMDGQPWKVHYDSYKAAGLLGDLGTVDNTKNPTYGSLTAQFNPSDLENEPGYQFRLAEGNKAINHASAARGNYLSGATQKALAKYGQDYAANEYTNAYNRFNNDQSSRFNRLATLSGIGQTANNQIGNANANYANSTSNLLTGNANAQGGALLAQGSTYANALNTIGGAGYNYYKTQPQTSTPTRNTAYNDFE